MGRVTARQLADDLDGSTKRVSSIKNATDIEDMATPFLVTREMAVALCDAVLRGELAPINFAVTPDNVRMFRDRLLGKPA